MPLPTPAQTFDRLQRAQAAWTRGGAAIVVSTTSPTGTKSVRFRLDLDGVGGATLRIETPAQGRSGATDQSFTLRGATIVGVDYDAREAIRRPAPDRGSVGIRLAAVLGGLEDAVGFLSDANVRSRYLSPLRALSGWQNTPHGLVRRTTAAGKASLTRLDLDATGKLKSLHIVLPGSRLDWSFAYGAYRPPSIPKGLKPVEAFTARPRPPIYADATARADVERLLRAGAGVRSAILRLDGNSTLWLGGSRIRYEAGGSGFAFDGQTLTVNTPGAAYQGRTSRGGVIDRVASLLGNVDPLARTFLVRALPFAELFPPEARVRVVGTMASGGQMCDVLDIQGPRFRASVFSRKSDGLPVSIETGVLDGRGRQVSTTRRTLAWSSVGAPLPRGLFQLRVRAGRRVLALPKRPTGP